MPQKALMEMTGCWKSRGFPQPLPVQEAEHIPPGHNYFFNARTNNTMTLKAQSAFQVDTLLTASRSGLKLSKINWGKPFKSFLYLYLDHHSNGDDYQFNFNYRFSIAHHFNHHQMEF
jgi:hypothetical protein